MSTNAIEKYYNEIKEAELNGMNNEQNIREYFYELLKNYTNSQNLKIERETKEFVFENGQKKNIFLDGRIKKENMVIGWVENKDAKDDLNKEIKNKKEKQYPLLNTIFENSKELVLFQDGKEVIRVNMSKSEELDKVLIKFVSFRPEEYKKFQDAFNNLKRILPDLAKDLREFFKEEKKINKKFKENLKEFTKKCQLSINNNITEELAIEMIIQHMLTRDIFVIFFQNANFHMNNIISKSISNILTHINQKSFEITEKIKSYTDCLSSYTKTITKDDKQDILKTFYSDFYKALNSKKADVQGIEYTPIQIVKFMVDASEQLLYKHFNKKLSSRDVNILDPCSGTGIFMAEIINRINLKDLEYKYKNELFSNEIDIMPYYISNLNIENAYFERTNSYEIFENICFLDTLEFQTKLGNNALFGMEEFSEGNVKRAVRQYEKKINLIIGNPPYNANQKSENDNNKNKVYIDLDKRIKDTYVNLSSAQKTKQYDMYKRFIRWASDRIKSEDDGIIAFITNNAYLDSRQDDGFRKSVQKEFDYIYIIDLKGNARKRNKSEGGNVFNIQTGVAIMFLIKKGVSEKQNKINPLNQKKANIKYYNIGDFLSGDKKLMTLQQDISFFDFEDIIPDNKGQWLNQTNNDFYEHTALIDKNVKNQKVGKAIEQKAIFKLFSLGIATNRDDWAYDFNKEQLEKKVKYFLKIYNKNRNSFKGINYLDENKNAELDYSIKWSRDLKKDIASNKEYKFNKSNIRKCLYRPFVYSNLYFDDGVIDVKGINNSIFPNESFDNISLILTAPEKLWKFANLVSIKLLDLHVFTPSGTINAPLYVYENGEKKLNITDYAIKEFQKKYKDKASPENIFAYCHAVLSSPKYQKEYEENLKIDYPRIPLYKNFDRFVELGKRLIKLQTEFENFDCRNEEIQLKIEKDFKYMPEDFSMIKLNKEKGIIIFDGKNRIENIPKKAFDYKIGTRSALDWIIDYYKPKKLNPQKELHHKTLIENGLNSYDYKNIREYLFELIPKVIEISVETVDIFKELEKLN
ncbi:type ISP restriction/modification enzyme [uncultured Brachyspira sp.]|uniref:type ISP restriction/modification enzyme n=1 Tax=uncultured Brachyspira sp. TaxID=221953 RepID=UPI00259B0B34|nr:type ISP restriction/modification enzyme [uncultured Brachyspira sp.]